MKGFLILSLFALVAISVTASPSPTSLEKREPEAQLEKREPEPSSTEKPKDKDGYGKKSDKATKPATSNALREVPTSMIGLVIAGAAAAQLI